MSATMALAADGFVQIGRLELQASNQFCIIWECRDAKNWRCANYAFVVGGEVLRIGKAVDLGKRLREWERNVTKRMNGNERSNTPATEAAEWLKYLNANGNRGEVFARQGNTVMSATGTSNLYEKEEKNLIAKYKPPLCKR